MPNIIVFILYKIYKQLSCYLILINIVFYNLFSKFSIPSRKEYLTDGSLQQPSLSLLPVSYCVYHTRVNTLIFVGYTHTHTYVSLVVLGLFSLSLICIPLHQCTQFKKSKKYEDTTNLTNVTRIQAHDENIQFLY